MPNYGTTGVSLSDLPRKPKTKSSRVMTSVGRIHQLPAVTVPRPSKCQANTERRYVSALTSVGLSFDDAVVRERCFQTDPFDRQFKTALINKTRRSAVRRHRNDISYLSKPVDPLSYLKKPAASSSAKSETLVQRPAVRAVASKHTTGSSVHPTDAPQPDSGDDEINRLSQAESASDDHGGRSDEQEDTDGEWDECLVLKLSANTARWIVQNPATSEDTRERLNRILDAAHGPVNIDDRVELVKETVSETDAAAAVSVAKKAWISDKNT